MIRNWYSRLSYAVAVLVLGTGMFFISGCGRDCCDSGAKNVLPAPATLAQIAR